ncbi:Ubiquitin carboxyl-terminal hydrolase, partial [Danaus plexippus plexippus]
MFPCFRTQKLQKNGSVDWPLSEECMGYQKYSHFRNSTIVSTYE